MLLQCRRENEFRGPLPAFLFLVFAMLAMTRGGLAMTRECGRYSFLVIARERSDRGDPVNAICVALRLHYLLDCFATFAMTRGTPLGDKWVCVGAEGQVKTG